MASHKPTLDKVYALLDTSDTKKGKLAFAREMGLLGDNYRRYVVSLSQVRNKFIHDVRNVGSTLETYMASLDANQISAFVRDVSLGYDRNMEVSGKQVPLQQFVRENLKYGFWLGALDLLSDIYIQKERVSLETRYTKFARELAEASHRRAIAPLLIKRREDE